MKLIWTEIVVMINLLFFLKILIYVVHNNTTKIVCHRKIKKMKNLDVEKKKKVQVDWLVGTVLT